MNVLAGVRVLMAYKWPIIGLAVAALLGGTYYMGYSKGSHKMEVRMTAKINAALEDQLKTFQAVAESDLKAAVRGATREAAVRRNIENTNIPATDDCSDPEWLRSYNDAVRAANGGTGGT